MTNREIDAMVAEKVMGWTVCKDPNCAGCDATVAALPDGDWYVGYEDEIEETFSPSTDIAAAWEVVEKMGLSVLYDSPTKRWQARQHVSVYDETASKWCDTAPRAICLAALKAVGVEVPE